MASETIERYPYAERYWYPHMGPEDAAIWVRFIKAFPDAYDECQYDVKVGKIPDMVLESPDPAIRGQAPLYQRKIDVVGWRDGKPEVIELKPAASASAIGQVSGYSYLYARDINDGVKPAALIITDRLLPEMEELADVQGVRIIAV